MVHEFKMPDLATTGAAVKIVRWLVSPPAMLKRGQYLLEVETDKATMEVESTTDGVLIETLVKENEAVDAGAVIARIEVSEAAVAAPTATPALPKKSTGLFARNRTAAALRLSPEKTATPDTPNATAPIPRMTSAAPGEIQKLNVARRAAATRLQQSKQTIPHFYLQTSANAGPMKARRAAALPDKLAWEAFFVSAVHRAIKKFEQMAYRFEDDQLIPQDTDTIGVAADVAGDLFVIPIEAPGEKSVTEISREIRGKVTALRAGDPLARAMKPGVMTITNLGSCNVETFNAIINPPESAILAIGKIQSVVSAVSDSAFAIQHRANLTLSVDHRVVNGKYAADFLGAIVEEIENP